MGMKRTLAVVIGLAAAAVPSAALAHSSHGHSHHPAHKLRATLKPVQADVAAYTAMRGKADLLANKRNAKSSLHLKGMVAKATYTWAVVLGDCTTNTPLTGWKYKRLRAGHHGNANSTGFAKKGAFTWDPSATYSVVVYQAGTTSDVLLCGTFKAKAKKKHSSHGKNKPTPHKPVSAPKQPSPGTHGKGHGHDAG